MNKGINKVKSKFENKGVKLAFWGLFSAVIVMFITNGGIF